MGRIRCQACRGVFDLEIDRFDRRGPGLPRPPSSPGSLAGTLTCGCGQQIPLEAEVTNVREDESIVKVHNAIPDLSTTVPTEVRSTFSEAASAFYGGAPRAALAMARAALEELLESLGYKQNDLAGKIRAAKSAKLLDERHVMLADGARLLGNNALHDGDSVSQAEAQSALSAATLLLTAISRGPGK